MIVDSSYFSFSFSLKVLLKTESMSEQKPTVYIYSCFQVIHVQLSILWITAAAAAAAKSLQSNKKRGGGAVKQQGPTV